MRPELRYVCTDTGLCGVVQLMRDAQYYSTAVVEEEGAMCAVVLASRLAEVRWKSCCHLPCESINDL